MVEITVSGDMMRRMMKRGKMGKEATLIGTSVDIVTGAGVENTVGFVVEGLDSAVTVMRRGRNNKGLLFFDNDPDDDTIFDLVKNLINLVGTVKNIRQLVSQEMFISLNNMSVRAFDIFKPPVDNYLYTSKPDGERLWLVKCGCMWLAVRNNRGGRVYGCVPAVKLYSTCKLGPLIDAEMTLYGKVILIDMLINERGVMLRQDRTITQVIEHCNTIKSMMPFITIREYFDSYEDAANYAAQCGYAVDGVIGIRMTSMNTIKLKPSRSIELKVGEDNQLLSSDDKTVAVYSNNPNLSEGDIMELRLSTDDDGKVIVSDTLLRYDKSRANNFDSCVSIMEIVRNGDETDPTILRRITQWCFRVREYMYGIAVRHPSSGVITLDIGTGRGQALGIMGSYSWAKYIMVEPNEKNVKQLKRSLPDAHVVVALEELMYMVPKLVTGSAHYVIYHGVAETLLEDTKMLTMIRNMMKTADNAVVSWPGNVDYNEPAVISSDFRQPIACFKGHRLVRYDENGTDADIHSVCQTLAVIATPGLIGNTI
ncbi:hypothetical protein BGZ90_002486 [Linnemannia elongata]|nr:hypothetical protein BGZ90_002486 [Linnemannia elongata]